MHRVATARLSSFQSSPSALPSPCSWRPGAEEPNGPLLSCSSRPGSPAGRRPHWRGAGSHLTVDRMADDVPKDLPQPPQHLADEAEERSAPHPSVVYEAIYSEGRDELQRSGSSLFFSGLAAGLSMGFSLISEALLRAYLPDAPWRPLVAKLGYSVGFLIVVLGRQQLFTENTLTVVLPVLRRRALWVFRKMVNLWAVVLVANLIGALGVAWAIG